MRCCVVFCFLFVCFGFGYVAGLKTGDKGVCVSKQSQVKTRPKTVLVALSKWCGKKKCTVRQTRQQKYTVITNRLMCCNGFVYAAETDSCAPVCSTGCANGTCVDPDVCHCASPLYLDPTTKNKCLTPICDHPCVNSQCSVNSTCICNEGYVWLNSTHCAPNCTEGFELNSALICAPKCEGCGNGTCVSPEVCECNSGYSRVNGSCTPVCKEKCINGWCSGPDVCSCDDGYIKKSATECQRSCSGECRANGTCLVMANISKFNITNVKVPCGKGKTCIKPKKIRVTEKIPVEICCDLYDYDPDTEKCLPTCKGDCDGGKCVAPNVCICDPPLIFNNATYPNRCLPPVCDTPCVNGVCTGNNQCTCNDGYALTGDYFTCVAQCTNCTNGDCVSPNVCECHTGYAMINNQCTPQCKNCSNGFCSAPDICTCDPGYEFKDTCKPVCESCVNAECVAPNACKCLPGYKSKDLNICVPECDSDCKNGFCSAPNVCTCDKGYEFKGGQCSPVCETPCVNASCVAPDTCKCFDGYETKGGRKEICAPKCGSCLHGVCTAPERCECNEGYTLIDGYCQPLCEDKCINGKCSGPNQCSCNSGYTRNETHPSICYIPCVCIGGTCSLEGECKCEHDMTLENGTCVLTTPAEQSGIIAPTTTGLASLQMTWWVAGAVGALLVVLVLVSISRIWQRRKEFSQKTTDNGQFASVAYTLPNTLIHEEVPEADEDAGDDLFDKGTNVV